MRVLVVHNRYRRAGGEEAVVAAEAEMLRSEGHSVDVWMTASESIDGFASTLRTAWNLPYSNAAKAQMETKLEQVRPDVVHIHNIFPLLTASIYDACHQAAVPVVQTLHNYRTICTAATLMRNGRPCDLCIDGSPYLGAAHACYQGSVVRSAALARMIKTNAKRGVWHRIDRFIALSAFAREKFIAAGFPADRIAVKPNFGPTAVDPAPEDTVERSGALFVGRLSEEKGIRPLMEAWQHLDVPLKVVGDGPLAAEVRLHRNPNIQVMGSLPPQQVQSLMRRSAMLVFPSLWYEGMPMTIIEAFQASLPVIASRLGVMLEMVDDGRTGLHFTAGDVSDLQAKVRWAEQHPSVMQILGRQAFEVFRERYTADRNYKSLLSIYRSAIAERRGGGEIAKSRTECLVGAL